MANEMAHYAAVRLSSHVEGTALTFRIVGTSKSNLRTAGSNVLDVPTDQRTI
jgi:uncharacterized protein YcbK (DUF882 family)